MECQQCTHIECRRSARAALGAFHKVGGLSRLKDGRARHKASELMQREQPAVLLVCTSMVGGLADNVRVCVRCWQESSVSWDPSERLFDCHEFEFASFSSSLFVVQTHECCDLIVFGLPKSTRTSLHGIKCQVNAEHEDRTVVSASMPCQTGVYGNLVGAVEEVSGRGGLAEAERILGQL